MLVLKDLVEDFWKYVINNKVELYNEFSLQFEFGIFLRDKLPGYKVQFERNVSFFGIKEPTVKHEIDIVIYNDDLTEKYALELKYPRQRQYPEQMYAFVKDIVFMEEVKAQGFSSTGVLTLVDSEPFYSGDKIDGIYQYFRTDKLIEGHIYKPTGSEAGKEHLIVSGQYRIDWRELDGRKYYMFEI